jgi:hypothetical protein
MLLPLLLACSREREPWVLVPGFEDQISDGVVCGYGRVSWWGYGPGAHFALTLSVPEPGIWYELGGDETEASLEAVTGENLAIDSYPCDDIVYTQTKEHDYHYRVVSGAAQAVQDGDLTAIEVEGVVLRPYYDPCPFGGTEGVEDLLDVPLGDGLLASF